MAEYIEREALIEAVRQYQYPYGVELLICNQPAVDVASVVHGEWVVCGDGKDVPWMCSHCGKTTAHKYKTMYGKYCPNCGARMEGE